MKSISVKKYFEMVNPKYQYLKITPIKSLRNYNSDKIINAVASTCRNFSQKVIRYEKKIEFKRQCKLSYMIYMDKKEISFYFIIPQDYITLFRDKISDTWKGITIETVDSLPIFNDKCNKHYLNYKKEDALSLSTDKRNNVLLSALLSVAEVMEEGDRCAVFYNFIPINQMSWVSQYDRTIEKLKHGYPIEKEKTDALFLLKMTVKILTKVSDFIIDTALSLVGDSLNTDDKVIIKDMDISPSTIKKRDSIVVKTQIILMSESDSKSRERNATTSLSQAFGTIIGDNELVAKRMTTPINYDRRKIKNADSFLTTPSEAQNFISLPARELIEEHGTLIDCISTMESEVPEELQTGYISLGENTFKGKKTEAFVRDTYDIGNFPIVFIGEQGSGKTTYISNYVKDIQKRDEGAIVIDFIKNCELASTIENNIEDKSKLIVLDLSNFDDLQGFGYNELKPRDNSVMELLDVANRKSLYVSMLVDALNIDGEPMSSSMDRYLSAASNVVLLSNKASLKDVIRCLENYEFRAKCINSIPKSLEEILGDEISALKELDNYSKSGEIDGTKMSKIDGVMHRINLLKKDLRLKIMFNKGCDENINLVEAMNEGKIILIKMPQEYFSTPYSKNTVVTYFFTKIWSSMIVRGSTQSKPKRFHVIVDEVFQSRTAMALLKDQEILPQTRKFGCKFCFSCQYLKQIGTIDQTLRSAGASYMLMKGSGKNSFKEFREELEPYTLDDMEALPQYHSLNLINYEKGRAKFITRLPKPL